MTFGSQRGKRGNDRTRQYRHGGPGPHDHVDLVTVLLLLAGIATAMLMLTIVAGDDLTMLLSRGMGVLLDIV